MSRKFNSIQFNSNICTRQLMNITLARTAKKKIKRIIKYMNEKRKKSINYENVRFQFCSEGVERESGITQVHRERVPHDRRSVVEPSWAQCQLFCTLLHCSLLQVLCCFQTARVRTLAWHLMFSLTNFIVSSPLLPSQ